MNFTNAEYQAYLARSQSQRREVGIGVPVTRERDLHDQIIEFCNSQFPRWKFIHARMDQKSTLQVGAPDFVIFQPGQSGLPPPRVRVIECKTKNGKLSPEQLIWHKEMEMLGHVVHVVRSYEEFMVVLNEKGQ
jgi:hypothetical protein